MKHAKDANHDDIKSFAKTFPGLSWHDMYMYHEFDALVSFQRRGIVVEIKNQLRTISAQRLTVNENKFRLSWTGEYAIVRTVEDLTLCLLDPKQFYRQQEKLLRQLAPSIIT